MSAAPIVQPVISARDASFLGVGRRELAGRRWMSPYRGIHVPTVPGERSPTQRVYDVAELLPAGAAIGGWAAAHLLGVQELDGRGRDGLRREPVLMALTPPAQVRHRDGITLLRSRLDDGDTVEVDGITVTSAIRTAFDLARLGTARESVVALDAVCRALRVDPLAVAAYIEEHRRYKGVPRARWAVQLCDPRARSTGESRLRLVWMLDAGLPRPEPNPRISTLDGHLLGIADLLDVEAGLVGEYDGGGHRDLDQHTADNAREEWLEAAGLVVVRATAVDVRRSARARTVARLHAGRRRGMARDRAADRWTWRPEPYPHNRM